MNIYSISYFYENSSFEFSLSHLISKFCFSKILNLKNNNLKLSIIFFGSILLLKKSKIWFLRARTRIIKDDQ
jgi:hypothetical protein